jgi:IclR family transcriptional regulator, acetate operon repressor
LAETLIQSVQRAMRVVECVAGETTPVSAKKIAHQTRLALSTVYHLLRTLVHDGYLVKDAQGDYALGPRLTAVTNAKFQTNLAVKARPILESLALYTNCSAFLSIYHDGKMNLVEMVEHPQAKKVELWVELDEAAHATALGKATLASLPPEQLADYLATHKLNSLTAKTITEADLLRETIQSSCDFAVDDGEYLVGVQCLAKATYLPDSTDSISIGISGARAKDDYAKRALTTGLEHLVKSMEFSKL